MAQVSFLAPEEAAVLSLAEEALRLVAEFRGRYGAPANGNGGQAISAPSQVYELMRHLELLAQEQVWVLLLDRRNRVLDKVMVYQGSTWCAVVRPAELLRPAIVAGASAIVLVHNHPSGDAEPSPDDIALTMKIQEACGLMDIDLLDHVVIGHGCCISLANRGVVKKGAS